MDVATAQTAERLGPNVKQACPSDGRRVDHRAHGEDCRVCWPPDGLYPANGTGQQAQGA